MKKPVLDLTDAAAVEAAVEDFWATVMGEPNPWWPQREDYLAMVAEAMLWS